MSCSAHYEKKYCRDFFFFPYFPENVVLQLLASCIHKQRTDATAFNSSLDPLSPHSRVFIFFFFFLKDTICERFNVISTWNLSYVYITKPSSSSDSASVNEPNMKSLAHNSFSYPVTPFSCPGLLLLAQVLSLAPVSSQSCLAFSLAPQCALSAFLQKIYIKVTILGVSF